MADYEKIEKALSAFHGSVLQSVNQVKRKLETYGINWHEFDEWVTYRFEAQALTNRWYPQIEISRECPECAKNNVHRPLRIMDVNTTTCTQVGGNWGSMWYCNWCEWTELSTKSEREESAPYRIKESTSRKEFGPPKQRVTMKKSRSRIVDPKDHRMLYYKHPRRRVR